ncbi:MAG: hypothetical protein LBB86_07390 [Oscillospiraceae bacterium]|nr:hypothetical protein [Oscillospiraceae bacterium]
MADYLVECKPDLAWSAEDNAQRGEADSLVKWMYSFAGKPCLSTSVVGYCNNISHRGYVTKNLLKSHDCLKKECRFLAKVNQNYWDTMRRQEESARNRRVQAQARELMRLERDAFIRGVMAANPHVYITMIQDDGIALVIYYIYDQYVDLTAELRLIRGELQRPVRLKAVSTTQDIIDRLIRHRSGTVA